MIRRSVWVKAAVFVVIAVLGIGYVAVHYIGVGRTLLGTGYTAYVDLPDSGGLFPSASVTYRGVEVGRVGPIALRGDGIRVTLDLSTDRKIPADARAVVGNGSPIGEQFVDLRPTRDGGPYLHDGSVIPESHTSLPVSTQELLVQLDRLVRSVPQDDLHTVVTELGAAFQDTGPSLRRLLDSTHQLLRTAQNELPATVDLINGSETVLNTQNDLSTQIASFSKDLATFTHAVRTGDGDLRTILREGVPASEAVTGLEHDIDATLPVLLGNLTSLGRVTQPRVPALRQVLIIYPYVVATSFGLFPGNGSTRFGVPVPPANDHQPCKKGYWPADKRRLPGALKYPPLRWKAFCQEPTNADINVRGSRMAPEPSGGRLGDKHSYRNAEGLGHHDSGSDFALSSYDATALGDNSWLWLLFGPMT